MKSSIAARGFTLKKMANSRLDRLPFLGLFEIAYAIRRGRIQPTVPHKVFLNRIRSRFKMFPVSDAIAQCAAELPDPFHGDPMDRIIAATAIVEDCTLISKDGNLRKANLCRVIW